MNYDEILSAEYRFGPDGYRERFAPTIRLTITPKPESESKPIHINLKVFRKKDAQEIVETVDTVLSKTEGSA
jgi:hypothetical protein